MKRTTLVGALAILVCLLPAAADPPAVRSGRDVDLGGALDRAVVADFDGDGVLDVARTDEDGLGVIVCLNRGDATFDVLQAAAPELGVGRMAAADLDGDGAAEVVVAGILVDGTGPIIVIHPEDTLTVILMNDGTGVLTPQPFEGPTNDTVTPCIVDLDGDGDLDVSSCRYWYDDTPGMHTFLNDGEGGFTVGPVIETREPIYRRAGFGDLDGDGLPELVCNRDFADPAVFPNLGGGEFGFEEAITPIPLPGTFLDITGDGNTDIVTGGSVYVGDGTRRLTFSMREIYAAGLGDSTGWSRAYDLADLDGDGDLDVVLEASPRCVGILENEGDGVFGRNRDYDIGFETEHLRAVAGGDFDGDGSPDILVLATNGARLLETGGVPAPIIDSVEPGTAVAGTRQTFTVTGADLTPETTLDFGPGNEITELVLESPQLITATVDMAPYGYDEPGLRIETVYDVVARDPYGGSTRVTNAIYVDPYWDFGIENMRGMLRDSGRIGGDRFRVEGRFSLSVGVLKLFRQAGESLVLVFGSPLDPYELTVPGDDPGWRFVGPPGGVTRMDWKSPKGALPKVRIKLRVGKGHKWDLKVKARGMDFPGEQSGNVWMELYVGDARAAGGAQWKKRGKGRFGR